MAKPIIMPQIGQDITKGTIIEWLVKENDSVQKGDIVAVVESEKASFEVEAYESGVILKILYAEGEDVNVLEPIAYIGKPGESVEGLEKLESTDIQLGETSPLLEEIKEEETGDIAQARIIASPSARRVAREHGIDLAKIKGSGPRGRIVKKDVLGAVSAAISAVKQEIPVFEAEPAAIPEAKAIFSEDKEIPFSRMRQKIAERLIQSKQTIPHFYLFIDVDMTTALAWRAAFNMKLQTKITVNDLIVKVTAFALAKFRRMNAHVIENKIIQRKKIHIGVAVSTEEGLLVPVISDTDQKDIQQISRLSRENSEAARKGILKARDIGTFTISNLGMYSINSFLPIINPPECAILGIGKVEKRVVPLGDNSIGIRDVLTLGLACDHRAVDGTYAAQFLSTIKNHLEDFGL